MIDVAQMTFPQAALTTALCYLAIPPVVSGIGERCINGKIESWTAALQIVSICALIAFGAVYVVLGWT